jgi:hypothetical protein
VGKKGKRLRFLAAHPQFDWMEGIFKSRPTELGIEIVVREQAMKGGTK